MTLINFDLISQPLATDDGNTPLEVSGAAVVTKRKSDMFGDAISTDWVTDVFGGGTWTVSEAGGGLTIAATGASGAASYSAKQEFFTVPAGEDFSTVCYLSDFSTNTLSAGEIFKANIYMQNTGRTHCRAARSYMVL